MIYVFIAESPDGEIETCRTLIEREIATDYMIGWAEDNGISLDPEDGDCEIYLESDDEGDYINQIINESAGRAIIIPCELEEY